MRIAVIGAGVVGVTTAYELASDGHEVTVFERHGSVAAESSFANAGLVAPGYVAPWAAPGMPRKVVSHLFGEHAPVRVGGRVGPSTAAWLWRWWRACRPAIYRANRLRMHRLALFSRERLHQLVARLHLDFERAQGFLVLLRSARDLALAEPGIRALAELGAAPQVLDAAGCRAVEPGLHAATALHAGIYSKDDEVGNCREFTHLLRREATQRGVRFAFGTSVERVVAGARPAVVVRPTPGRRDDAPSRGAGAPGAADAGRAEGIGALSGEHAFDAVVVCASIGSTSLLHPLGVRIPLLPVYGYSVTAPLRHDDAHLQREPRAALMDERYKVAISRLGQRVRVAGSAEIGGRGERSRDAYLTLDKVLDDWFPGVTQRAQAQRWRGARPMLPDGPPVLGASGAEGVWLNLGHGGSGWALACGSARLLADAVAGRAPSIDIGGLGIERLR